MMATVAAMGRWNADEIRGGKGAVLMSVVRGATCYPEVMAETGLAKSVVWGHLHRLRDEGLVTFEDGKRGTLRPRLAVAAILP